MDKICMCKQHDRLLELYCNECKSYICAECLSTHDTTCPNLDYTYVFARATEVSLPKLQQLIDENEKTGYVHEVESTELLTALYNIITPLKRVVKEHTENMEQMKAFTQKVESFSKGEKKQTYSQTAERRLKDQRSQLQSALGEKNVLKVLAMTDKVMSEQNAYKGSKEEIAIINQVKEKLKSISFAEQYKELSSAIQALLFQCQQLRLNRSYFHWKCDSKYLSHKLCLSEDGLQITCCEGGNYAAVIGDTPIEYGIMAFEVVANGLCCKGKEGFGVIEYEKYKKLYEADKNAHGAYNDMLGIMHGDVIQNMLILTGNELLLGIPYVVCINMCDHVLNIKGPGALLTAELKPEVSYVPCFSLGCTNNKMVINPIEAYLDDDQVASTVISPYSTQV